VEVVVEHQKDVLIQIKKQGGRLNRKGIECETMKVETCRFYDTIIVRMIKGMVYIASGDVYGV
jgi:hypothetical protein